MKIKRIRAGVYQFKNDHRVSGEILKQPEGGWSIYLPSKNRTWNYCGTYRQARAEAESIGRPF